jgi:hypothetical protein
LISEQIDMLKAMVNGLSIKAIAAQGDVDNAVAAHALADVLGRWTGEVTVEAYVLAIDAGVEVALEMVGGSRACLACQAEGLDGYLHKEVL